MSAYQHCPTRKQPSARSSLASPWAALGRADEIAAAAVLLASEEAAFMTGSNLIIDGGLSL